MRLLTLLTVAVAAVTALLALALRGGAGDRGDGVRRVRLPPPSSHLRRVAVLVTTVLVGGAALASEHRLLMQGTESWIARLLRAGGIPPQRVVAYAPEVYPLLGSLLLGSLLLFHLIRPAGLYSRLVGIAVTALTALTLLLVDAAVDALAAVAAIPVVTTVYAVNLASLVVGLLGFMAGLLRSAALPRRYRYRPTVSGLSSGLVMTAVAIVAVLAGGVMFRLVSQLVQPTFAGSALLVFLVVPVTFLLFQLLLFAYRRKERPGSPDRWDLPLDVIMPAWNEEEQIEVVLGAIDRAASRYPGRVRVIVADDGSADATPALVDATARQARAAEIVLLRGPHAGKAPALNRALEYATADVVIRIDADIVVHPDAFTTLPGWFANRAVGCVGAFNLPNFALPAWYTKARLFECLYTFGFSRLAYERLDGNNIPGTYMAFRRAEALALGGFVEGMNGEDSDLTFNLGRIGLVSVIDPAIVVYEDVPQGFRAFVEQRTRWARASIHLAARHLPREAGEYTGRFAILLHFVYGKVAALVRPVTYVTGAAFVLGSGRPGDMALRGLILLALGFVPQFGLLAVLAMTYGFWRQIPWLVMWIPFTMARKLGMLNGVLSVPASRTGPMGQRGAAEPAAVTRPAR